MSHPLNLMIDLETFGQDIGSAIMTIGAIGADKWWKPWQTSRFGSHIISAKT